MTIHIQTLKNLFSRLVNDGFDVDPEEYINSANESLEEFRRLMTQAECSPHQRELYNNACRWLVRIRKLAEDNIELRKYSQQITGLTNTTI